MELLEKSRETAVCIFCHNHLPRMNGGLQVQDADTAETQLAKAEERNAMLQRLLEKSGVEEPDDSMSQSPERDEGHQEEDVDPNDNAALNRHVASLRSKLEQCEREKEDVEDAMADLKEKLKEQLFCLKMAQQSLKIRDFMNTSM